MYRSSLWAYSLVLNTWVLSAHAHGIWMHIYNTSHLLRYISILACSHNFIWGYIVGCSLLPLDKSVLSLECINLSSSLFLLRISEWNLLSLHCLFSPEILFWKNNGPERPGKVKSWLLSHCQNRTHCPNLPVISQLFRGGESKHSRFSSGDCCSSTQGPPNCSEVAQKPPVVAPIHLYDWEYWELWV